MQARAARPEFSREHQVFGIALIAIPVSLVAAHWNWAASAQFFISVVAVIPLAAFIGAATEALADRFGGTIGGLLNASFGNAPDLLVGVFGVQKGLIPLVKATLIGALMSNSALIMGVCCVCAGLMHGQPRFRRRDAGHHSVLMMLTLAAVVFPSLGAVVLCGGVQCRLGADRTTILHASIGIAVILLLAYAAYVLFAALGFQHLPGRGPVEEQKPKERAPSTIAWPSWFATVVLIVCTVALIPITDILTSSVTPVTGLLGWSSVFVGIVIIANAGNAAEAYAAIRFAILRGGVDPEESDSGLDLALGIASASSIQIAAFIAPLIVLYSLFGHHMTLVFSPVELAILALLTMVFAYICQDGESNWLEGAQLIALYAMAAVVFYTLPVSVFAG
jgi:Ca2+:H+ antiporter